MSMIDFLSIVILWNLSNHVVDNENEYVLKRSTTTSNMNQYCQINVLF
jgi:hypothetical protein